MSTASGSIARWIEVSSSQAWAIPPLVEDRSRSMTSNAAGLAR
jgi:hypothetical protein